MMKMYQKKNEIKSLSEWMKEVKMYDLHLSFNDGTQKETQTIAFSQEQAAYNGLYMNFGNGLANNVQVTGSHDMTVRKFKGKGYKPSNIGLIEVELN